MENSIADIERIEQQLQELRIRFSKADLVLRELEEIQIQFEDLGKTYERLKGYVSEVSQFNAESNEIIKLIQETQKNFEKRFNHLRDANELKLEELNSEVSKLQNESASQGHQIQKLQSDIEILKKDIFDFRDTFNDIQNQFKYLLEKDLVPIKQVHNKLNKQFGIMRNVGIALFILNLFLVVWVWLK